LARAVKIKTIILLFGWLIIFMHGIIPHNHLQEQHNGCHELYHNITANNTIVQDKNSEHSTAQYSEKTEDAKVCHFSSFLFNNYNHDRLIITATRETYFLPQEISVTISFYNSESYSSEPYYGSTSLRAPPVPMA
jgi:hypothetical protein